MQTIQEAALQWGIGERQVRTLCENGRIPGAKKQDGMWLIPADAVKPTRKSRKPDGLLTRLQAERKHKTHGGIYHRVQVDMTYNSNHIEGSKLTKDQTRFIYETKTIGLEENAVIPVNDIVETVNHFRCMDFIIDTAEKELTQPYIKRLHALLKSGTEDSLVDGFAVGDYKKFPNEGGDHVTTPPENVSAEMARLLANYKEQEKTLETLVSFHADFESIHPFQDGNGRVGRLILFKECLHYGIVPFIITDELRLYYYRGLSRWKDEKGFLMDTCLTAQDAMKKYLDYFRIPY